MNNPVGETNPEYDPGRDVYLDLIENILFVFDDAFESGRSQHRKTNAEFVQPDRISFPGETMFSVLLSETGGKPDRGAEMITLLARPLSPDLTVVEAMEQMHVADEFPFQTDQYYIIHQSADGTKKYMRIDDSGLYPWVPELKDITDEITADVIEINEAETVIDLLQAMTERQAQTEGVEEALERLDRHVAEDLIGKISTWMIIPQN